MSTAIINEQKPAVPVFVKLTPLMRYLPQQGIKILHGTRAIYMLGNIGTTGRIGAITAFFIGS
jgi:hypothetical protein